MLHYFLMTAGRIWKQSLFSIIKGDCESSDKMNFLILYIYTRATGYFLKIIVKITLLPNFCKNPSLKKRCDSFGTYKYIIKYISFHIRWFLETVDLQLTLSIKSDIYENIHFNVLDFHARVNALFFSFHESKSIHLVSLIIAYTTLLDSRLSDPWSL